MICNFFQLRKERKKWIFLKFIPQIVKTSILLLSVGPICILHLSKSTKSTFSHKICALQIQILLSNKKKKIKAIKFWKFQQGWYILWKAIFKKILVLLKQSIIYIFFLFKNIELVNIEIWKIYSLFIKNYVIPSLRFIFMY